LSHGYHGLKTKPGGKILVEEPDTATTVLVSSVKFLNEKRQLVNKFWLTSRTHRPILKNPEQAQKIMKIAPDNSRLFETP
jgi:hypothetical protein